MTETNRPITPDADSEDSVASLYRLITSGQIASLADLQSRLESPAEKQLVKRASLVNAFDETLFNEALQLLPAGESPKVTFDQFISNSSVEEVPRTDRVFRIKDSARQDALREWQREITSDSKVTQSQFFTKLVEHYQNRDDLERLGLLVVTEPEKAKTLFNDLFEAADKYFDLAKCNDIVKVLEDRALFLNDDLRELSRASRQYLNARNLFARDYYQTAFYYARNSVLKSFKDLLKADGKSDGEWIFQLYAKGGMGKTMFVKWLLARHCVPNKIPIARLDFDFVHLPTAVRFPLLLLLAIADQLNTQIPDSAFESYLRSYFKFISLLRPPDGAVDDIRQNTFKQLQDMEVDIRDDIVGRFGDALEQSKLQNNVIIAFDTLEEMSLNRKQTLMVILNQLKQIHTLYPKIRLLLSGRYNLEERLPKFSTDFSKQAVTYELEPFKSKEARAYLTERRSLRSKSIVGAIIKKCKAEADGKAAREGLNPFKLSLFADLYQQREVKTVKEILSYPNTDIAYLIERVVRRIKEPTVQWLLRYAVVPRQFTFEIFEKVLAYHLEQELIKNRQLDQVNQKFPKGAEAFNNQKNWKDYTNRGARTLDVRAIWNNLRKYASGYSFVSFDTGDDSSPRLQPEVTVPMRRLLEAQDIFTTLHRDCEKYFLQKATKESDPIQRAQLISEAIYHRFQRDGSKAAKFWRAQLEGNESRRKPRVRKILAEEILGKDYIDDAGEPIRDHERKPLLELPDLREAYLRSVEAAVSLTVNLKSNERSSAWAEISERLEGLQRFDTDHRGVRSPRATEFDSGVLRRLAWFLQQTRPNFKSTIPVLREAVKSASSFQMEIALRLQFADALAAENERTCLPEYKKVLKLVRSHKFSQVFSSSVLLKIGLWHQRQRDFTAAQRLYREVLRRAEKEKNLNARLNALRFLADISLELGRYDEALQLLNQVRKKTDREGKTSLLDALLVSQIQGRSLYQPLQALAGIEPFAKNATTVQERAAMCELRGDLFGQLMRFGDALELLEEAKNLWVEASNNESADRARILRIEVQLFEIGNLNEADYLLKVAEDLNKKNLPDLVSHLKLLRIHWAHRLGNQKLALRLWKKLVADKKFAKDQYSLIKILAAGLALGLADRRALGRFCKLLGTVDRLLRVPLLEAFELGEAAFNGTPSQKRTLERLVSIPLSGKELIPHALRCASVLGWCGSIASAKRYLDRAAGEALRSGNSFAYQKILLAKDRFGVTNPKTDALSKSHFLKEFSAYPTLCGAVLCEQAQRYFNQSNHAACKSAIAASRKKFAGYDLITSHVAALDNLAGELANEQGKNVEAGTHFRAALSKYEKLGNKFAVKLLQDYLPTLDRPVERDATAISLWINPTSKQFLMKFYENDHEVSSAAIYQSDPKALLPLIRSEIKQRSDLYKLSKLLIEKPKEVGQELGRIMFDNWIEPAWSSSKSKPVDLSLDSMTPAIAKMPWELAVYKNKPVTSFVRNFYRSASQTYQKIQNTKWLQLALNDLGVDTLVVDGVLGKRTQVALDQVRRKHKWPARLTGAELNSEIGELLVKNKPKRDTRALLIRSSDSSRAKAQSLIDWIYEDCYFTARSVGSDVSFKDELTLIQPDVIHMQCAFREIPGSGEIYLDFGQASDNPSSYQRLTASLLNQSLAAADETKLLPLIILDAIGPSTPTEVVQQLFYRNAFAAQLFQGGHVSAVLAIGLTPNFDLYRGQITDLVSDLSNTVTFGKLTNSLRTAKASNFIDRIATQGIALYANEPWLTLLTAAHR